MTKKEVLSDYKRIDNNILDERGNHELVSDLVKIRNEIEENSYNILPEISAEIHALSFSLKSGRLGPKISFANGYAYPTTDLLKEEEITYLRIKADKTKNPAMKTRYAHVIWLLEKDYKFAQKAIDGYTALASIYKDNDKEKPENHYGLSLRVALKEGFILSKQISYKTNGMASLISNTIFHFNKNSTSYYAVVIDLIRLCLDNKNDFEEGFWIKAKDLCVGVSEELKGNNNYFFSRHYLELAGKIDLLVFNKQTQEWKVRLAESFEEEAAMRGDKDYFAKANFIQEAMSLYQQSGRKDKVEELVSKHKDFVGKIEFTKFEIPFDAQGIIDDAEKNLEKLKQMKPKEILDVLTKERLFIGYDEAKEEVEKSRVGGIAHLFTSTSFDQKSNIAKHSTKDDEKEYEEILQHLGRCLDIEGPWVDTIFKGLLLAGSISPSDIIDYVKDRCWFGKEYEFIDSGKVAFTSRKWVDLIKPSITRLFEEFEKFHQATENGEKYSADSILIIDSLTLKFEGIVREAFELNSKSTSFRTEDNKGSSITKEKDLNVLLREDFAEKVFGKDLLLVLKYVFIERTGFNLRNNVAHTLIQKEHYLFFYVYILMILLLKMGAINPKVEKEAE